MTRATTEAPKSGESPLLLEWSEERLRQLDQAQLLNLLANLDHMRALGRLKETTAIALDERITSLLTKRSCAKRRSDLGKTGPA